MMNLKFAKVYDDALTPTRKHSTDAGLDLYARIRDEHNNIIIIKPGKTEIIETGIAVRIPPYHFGWITNKSKNNWLVGAGVVDEGYQGQLLVKIHNVSSEPIMIGNEQAIAQLLIIPCKILGTEEVLFRELYENQSERKASGGIIELTSNIEFFNNKIPEFRIIEEEVYYPLVGYNNAP